MKKNSSYWYCPNCKEELDGCHVTYQELCEYCGTAVLSVPESISQETIEEIIKAKADGRLVVLPPPEESDYEGLKVKYRVYKAKDNTPVENCFVLRPEKDLAAVAALTAYAHATDNKQLAEDILNWITPDERVKVLSCKVGDTVYAIHNIPNSDKKVMVEVQADLFFIVLSTCEGRFGKTVFLTREDAEKAIGGKEDAGKK